MNKTLFSLMIIPLILMGCTPAQQDEEVHIHAGFQVYIDDVLQDYSGPEKMYFAPCGATDDDHDSLHDKVHQHNEVGDVAHVHSAGMNWQDLLDSRSIVLPEDKSLNYYLNGVETPTLLSQEIQDRDSVIFIIGNTSDINSKIEQQVTTDRIHEVEEMKENCGH